MYVIFFHPRQGSYVRLYFPQDGSCNVFPFLTVFWSFDSYVPARESGWIITKALAGSVWWQ